MNDATRALQLWSEYAPKFYRTLETDDVASNWRGQQLTLMTAEHEP